MDTIRWKLKEYLDTHGVSAYRLAEHTHGRLSRTGIYRLTAKDLKAVRFETLAAVIPALRDITGEEVQVGDLLEYVPAPDPDAEALEAEHRAWEGAILEPLDSPALELYDWDGLDPLTLGEPLHFEEGKGWVKGG
jgi:DNA-binding Xre family transcriptional regulator